MEFVELRTGQLMPSIMLGTWKSPLGKTGIAVKEAIKAGYRGVDCANDYGNEAEIGQALKELFDSGVVKREEVFIQAKLWNSNHKKEHVRPDLEATLKDLQLTYVDSFVIHWPQACPGQGKLAVRVNGPVSGPASAGTMFPIGDDGKYCSDNDTHFTETWAAMEELVDAGLTKSIGLSNFNAAQIREVIASTKKHFPAVLQNECHPYLQQKDLIDLCNFNKIVFQGYSPLGSYDRPWAKAGEPELLEDPEIIAIAKKYKKSPAQVVIRWHLQRYTTLCPKSVTPERIRENYKVFDFLLSPEDMIKFDSFNRNWRHLVWGETAMHPDFPFKDDLAWNFVPGQAPVNTTKSSRA